MRNIVIVTFDSLRADHCGYMGYERNTTPNLDTMANDGTAFTNAIAPASRTNPSMAGIMTGEPMVFRDRVSNPDISRYHLTRHETIAEELSNRGYTTGAFNPNAYASRYYGFDRGFDYFEDFMFSSNRYREMFKNHLSSSGIYTILRNFRNYLRRQEAFKTWDRYIDDIETWARRQEEPFFLWIFSLDTHFPHLTPKEYRRWSNLVEQYYYNWRCNQLIDDLNPDLTEKEIRKIIDIYDDSIRFGDVLLYELQERLEQFDPVYIVFGDHGEAFGERGIYGHFYPSLHEESIHVPLVVSEPIDIDDVTRPISLTHVPSLIRTFAGVNENITPKHWAIASDYDGRNDRNLITARTKRAQQVTCWEEERIANEEIYSLSSNEQSESGSFGEDSSARAIQSIVRRRYRHEQEMLGVRSGAADLAGQG